MSLKDRMSEPLGMSDDGQLFPLSKKIAKEDLKKLAKGRRRLKKTRKKR